VTAKTARAPNGSARIRELEDQLARANKTVEALREVGLALGTTLDLDELLELILGKIKELLEADRATLYQLDERRGVLSSRVMIGNEPRSIELKVGEGIAGHVAKTGRAIRVKNAYRDKRFNPEWDELTGYRTRSILAAPMKNHMGRIIGVIQVLNKGRGGDESDFSTYDEELLTALATQAAVSIDNSALFHSVIQKNIKLVDTQEQLEHRVSDLKLLFDLESAMGRATTVEDLASAVISEAARACQAQAGALLIDEHEQGLWLYFVDVATTTNGTPNVRRIAAKRGEGMIGAAMTQDRAVSAPPVDDAGAPLSRRISQLLGGKFTCGIAIPLDGQHEDTIGALGLYNSTREGGFSQDDRALLRMVAANASTAVRFCRERMELERSERLTSIGRLLSGVMHDMRTPLTVISGYVQLMASADDRATRAEHARIVLKQFDVLSAMQREVLEFARGERSILVRKVYLLKFFEDLEKQLTPELEATNVRLVMNLEDRGTARFDEAKLTRVVHNLARNAIEAMGATGGTLTISASREEGALVLRFADTGKGIPKDVEGRLFQSFVSAGKRGGTGIGLAIVKKIVDEHQGSIEVASTDHGATFTIRLPQPTVTQATSAVPARAELGPGRPRARAE
jgi:signal transduction histidine kinase/putative methionine-R-sulfoxide reductase with GAF domain